MSRFRTFLTAFIVLASSYAAAAQDMTALANVLPDRSVLRDDAGVVTMTLGLSQGVPFRIFTLDAPRRVVLDFNVISWTRLDPAAFDQSDIVTDVRVGPIRDGWSRMVMDIAEPLTLRVAGLTTLDNEEVTLSLVLVPIDAEQFAATAGAPAAAQDFYAGRQSTVQTGHRRQTGDGPLVVVLDPGHGGIDPGAEHEGTDEKDLMLTFARELKEVLLRSGSFEVILTRQADEFVPLEMRVSLAREAGADVFLSLHADALVEGRASGATIYTLSDDASDIASQKLAERHERSDLLAGVDLSQQDDEVASVLMDLARTETAPRSEKLALALVKGLSDTVGMHKRPHLSAGFSVLKAPDIPSVLVELGFLSSPRDRKRLLDPAWRQQAAGGIRDALQVWQRVDAEDAGLLRK